METYKLVMPEHLNHHGFLFGGNMLKWVDEYTWIAATKDYPGCSFVTIGLDKVEFKKNVKKGIILRFEITKQAQGTSSVTYLARVYKKKFDSGDEEQVFSTNATLVNICQQGKKCPLPGTKK